MQLIFQHPGLQAQFERDGYLVLPWLEAAALQRMQTLLREAIPETPERGFYSTSFLPDYTFKKQLSEQISGEMNLLVRQIFQDYKTLGAGFLLKQAGTAGRMPLHQDWTVVDESQYRSITIWIPLIDVNAENGAIRVLPGSHEYHNILRAPTLPPAISHLGARIEPHLRTLEMKAGQAFIFDQSLIHCSHDNNSTVPRPALTYGLTHSEAQLVYYYQNPGIPDAPVEKLAVGDDFFLRYHNIGERPDFGTLIATVEQDTSSIPEASMAALLKGEAIPVIREIEEYAVNTAKPMKPLFIDPILQEQFEKDGYVKIPLLNEEDVRILLDYYHSLPPNKVPEYGFHVSMDNEDREYVKKVYGKLLEVMAPKADQFFQDYQIFTGSYVVKETNPKGVIPPHQDWTFVNEEEFCSVTVWTPLQEVTMDNGALGVIHGSHTFFGHHRASPSPQARTPLGEHMFSIFPYLDIIDMKAGEALVFNNKTIHASPPNTSEKPRIAAGIGITQKEAQLVHYYLLPETDPPQLERYEIEPEFFTRYDNGMLSNMHNEGQKPEGVKVSGHEEYKYKKVSADRLLELIKSHPKNQMNGPLIEKMAKLFNYNMDGTKKEESKPEPAPKPDQAKPERKGLLARLKKLITG